MSSPKFARMLLNKILLFKDNSFVMGDLEEFYNEILKEKGRLSADTWYWCQLIRSVFPLFQQKITWGGIMFRHNIKFMVRNLLKQKIYTLINLFGLTIGFVSVFLIMLWVFDELSYDKFHENIESVYTVLRIDKTDDGDRYVASTPNALAPALEEGFSDIIKAARTVKLGGIIKIDDKQFTERTVLFTNTSFFEIFTFPLAEGAYFDDEFINSVLITEETAFKYFGKNKAVGKVINFNDEPFSICGVLKNIPPNSSIEFNVVANYQYAQKLGIPIDSWSNRYSKTYVKLNSPENETSVNEQIRSLIKQHIPESNIDLTLQKFENYHLFGSDNNASGSVKIYLFSGIAFLILLIASINFVNLSTARSIRRLKEIGVRKVLGSDRIQLINQFIGESVFLSLLSLGLAIIIAELLLSDFNLLLGKNIVIDYSNTSLILLLIGTAIFTGIISALYPAYVLSSHNPAQMLKNNKPASGKSSVRKVLLVIQYTISIALITGIISINEQVDYLLNKDTGINKDNMLYINLSKKAKNQAGALKEELLKNSRIKSVTMASDLAFDIEPLTDNVSWSGKDPDYSPIFTFGAVDFDFVNTFDIKIPEGRNYSNTFSTDSSGILLNRKAADIIGLENIVDKSITLFDRPAKVLGVLDNFHCRSLKEDIEPLILAVEPSFARLAIIKFNNEISPNDLEYLKNVCSGFSENQEITINNAEETYASLYEDENKLKSLLMLFTLVAIVLSSLGLLSMSSFMTEQRKKEIAIRKVLGAAVSRLLYLLSWDFLKYILISNAFGWTIAYFLLSSWYQNYSFGTGIDVRNFIMAGVFSILITSVTIFYHILKSVFINPHEVLKSE